MAAHAPASRGGLETQAPVDALGPWTCSFASVTGDLWTTGLQRPRGPQAREAQQRRVGRSAADQGGAGKAGGHAEWKPTLPSLPYCCYLVRGAEPSHSALCTPSKPFTPSKPCIPFKPLSCVHTIRIVHHAMKIRACRPARAAPSAVEPQGRSPAGLHRWGYRPKTLHCLSCAHSGGALALCVQPAHLKHARTQHAHRSRPGAMVTCAHIHTDTHACTHTHTHMHMRAHVHTRTQLPLSHAKHSEHAWQNQMGAHPHALRTRCKARQQVPLPDEAAALAVVITQQVHELVRPPLPRPRIWEAKGRACSIGAGGSVRRALQ